MRICLFIFTVLTIAQYSLIAQFDEAILLDGWLSAITKDIHLIDLNQDGEEELIGVTNNDVFVINQDAENSLLFNTSIGTSYVSSRVIDFNNDGKSELAFLTKTEIYIYEMTDDGFEVAYTVFVNSFAASNPKEPPLIHVHTNTDGTQELFYSEGTKVDRVVFQPNFYSHVTIDDIVDNSFGFARASVVQLADQNNDGLQDLFSISQQFNTLDVNVRLSSGTTFSSPTALEFDTDDPAFTISIPNFDGPSFSMDVDNDGDDDFIVSSYETKVIYWIENIEADLIGLPKLLSVNFNNDSDGFTPNKMIKFDVNGDGLLDIVVATSKDISWYRNNGNATFEKIFIADTGDEYEASGLEIGNIDDDNVPDLAYSARNPLTSQLNIFLMLNQNGAPISAFSELSADICSLEKSLSNKSSCYFPDCTVTWDFGNGTQSNEINPTVTYEASGVYEVSLEVCNDFGCDTSYGQIAVIAANVELPETIPLGVPYQFVDNTPFIENRTWSFGDGEISNEAVAEHTYTFPGVYFVQLFLNTSNPTVCQFVIEKEITVPPLLEDDDGLIVLPNPMIDQCQVIFDNKDNKPFRIQIFNNLGQEIFDDESAVDFYYSFNNDLLIEGVYYIHLTLDGVFVDTKKLIVVEP